MRSSSAVGRCRFAGRASGPMATKSRCRRLQAFADTDPLNRRVVEQMLIGVATRQYGRSLEPLPARISARGAPARAR